MEKKYKNSYEVEAKVTEIKQKLEEELGGKYDVDAYGNDEVSRLQNKLEHAGAEDEEMYIEELKEVLRYILMADMKREREAEEK